MENLAKATQIMFGRFWPEATVGLLATTLGRLYSSAFYALKDTRTPLNYALIRVFLTTALGYFCGLKLPGLLGISASWGTAGLTASAGISGWVEFALLRRGMNARIGRTNLAFSFLAKLWGSALMAAGVAWCVKLSLPDLHRIPRAATVLGVYGILYFIFTAMLGVPESKKILRKFY